jgi:hypothetical protein
VAHISEIVNVETILNGKFENKRLISGRSELNIKIVDKNTGLSGVDQIQLARYRALVDAAMYLPSSVKGGN